MFGGGRQRDVGGRRGGRLSAEAGGKRLQPLQQVRPAFISLLAVLASPQPLPQQLQVLAPALVHRRVVVSSRVSLPDRCVLS